MSNKVLHGGFTRVSLLLDSCAGPLDNMQECERVVETLLGKHKMKVVGETRVPYGSHPCGYICNWTLEESFLIVETWPEIRRVKAIIDLCDFKRSNEERTLAIADGIVQMYRGEDIRINRHDERDEGVLIDKAELDAFLAKYNPVAV